MHSQSDQLPRALFVPVEPVKAAGLLVTESSAAGVAAGAAVHHVAAADRLQDGQQREKRVQE